MLLLVSLLALASAPADVPALVLPSPEGGPPLPQGLAPGQIVTAIDVPRYGDSLDPRSELTLRSEPGATWTVSARDAALQVVKTDTHAIYLGRVRHPERRRHVGLVVLTAADGRILDQATTALSSFSRVRLVDYAVLDGAELVFSIEATRRSCPGGFSGELFSVRSGQLHTDAHYGGYGEAGDSDEADLYVPVRRDGRIWWQVLGEPDRRPHAGLGRADRLLRHRVVREDHRTVEDSWSLERPARTVAVYPRFVDPE